jgi:hypothetical protein
LGANHLDASFILHCERSGKLEGLSSLPAQRDALLGFARASLNLTTRTALSTSDIRCLPSMAMKFAN